MKEALRTSGTSSRAQAGALGMFGADGVLVRVSAVVGRGLADAVFVVVIGRVDVVESEVRAARIEVVGERLVLVGALEIGVYVLEGRGERGSVGVTVAAQRAALGGARGVRGKSRGAEGRAHRERDEGGLLFRAGLPGHLEHADNLLAQMAVQGLESGGNLLAAQMVRGNRLAVRCSRGRGGRGRHGCVERERRWWERERRV